MTKMTRKKNNDKKCQNDKMMKLQMTRMTKNNKMTKMTE